MKQNLHTHTRYCDGKDTVEEMVVSAIEKKFDVLGFSGHGYCRDIDYYSMNEEEENAYREDVLKIKNKYDEIKIYLGIEQDVLGKRFSKNMYDYVIGSVHFLKVNNGYLPVDESKQTLNKIVEYYQDFYQVSKAYYEEVIKLAYMDEVDIIGHIDLLTKFNEDESYISFHDDRYLSYAFQCIDICIQNGKIFEVNTGAIARGMRKTPYPHQSLLEYIYKQGGKICLNSDCHDRNKLDCWYQEAIQYIKSCGFHSVMILTDEGFCETNI